MASISTDPLSIIIVGAGISGLSSAITLAKAGQKVKIYERTDGNNELGAAIMLSPNAGQHTATWGLDPAAGRFVRTKSMQLFNGATLETMNKLDYTVLEDKYAAPWWLCHRVDLHNMLKQLAIKHGAELIVNHKVVEYDPEIGKVTLADGTTDSGDLIIGADGIHSTATKAVLGEEIPSYTTDQSCFRFLLPTSELAADPTTSAFLEGDDGRFKVYLDRNGNRLVWYPCRDNQEHNMAAIIHEVVSPTEREDWNTSVTQESLLQEYQGFHPSLISVLKKTKNLKKWPLLSRPPISRWFKGHLVLVGDAIHPMLPHQGQAGAQAIEDAVALGVLFNGLTKSALAEDSSLLEKRLKMFEKIRCNRAAAIQILSSSGQHQPEKLREQVKPYIDGYIPTNPAEFLHFNYAYDVKKHSEDVLKEESMVSKTM